MLGAKAELDKRSGVRHHFRLPAVYAFLSSNVGGFRVAADRPCATGGSTAVASGLGSLRLAGSRDLAMLGLLIGTRKGKRGAEQHHARYPEQFLEATR